MPTQKQIDRFYEFASTQLAKGGRDLSMDEIYYLWRAKQPTPAELAESVGALRAAYAELEAGHQGRPAREALRETCIQLGLVLEE